MEFSFASLKNGQLGVSKAYGEFCAEAAQFCLEHNHHTTPVVLQLTGDNSGHGKLIWENIPLSSEHSWEDSEEATEYGAYAVGIVVALQLTGMQFVRRSAKGTGFDFRMGSSQSGDLFQETARLEISGLLKGTEAGIQARLQKKLKQLTRSDSSNLLGYAAIVEFGAPEARLVQKQPEQERCE